MTILKSTELWAYKAEIPRAGALRLDATDEAELLVSLRPGLDDSSDAREPFRAREAEILHRWRADRNEPERLDWMLFSLMVAGFLGAVISCLQ